MIQKRRKKFALATSEDPEKKVIFIESDLPPLKAGEYTVKLQQDVNLNTGEPYTYERQFAVSGQRFTLNPQDFNSVFPPDLATGEFSATFPLIIFNKRTLPWERTSVMAAPNAPWLALLLFNEDEVPEIMKLKVKDLVPLGTTINMRGNAVSSDIEVKGTMPLSIFSYPYLNDLDYGETPEDPLNAVDIPVTLFNSIAPSASDLPYLAHIRDTETIDKTDNKVTDEALYAVISGNRIPEDGANAYVFLVSLENFGDYLPNESGQNNFPEGYETIRLITYKSWHYTVNDGGQTLEKLLEDLNKYTDPPVGLTTLQFPFEGGAPSAAAVQQALQHQASGTMTADDAQVLVHNAFTMGYLPMDQVLRHPGNTVSWYRGPLSPFYVPETAGSILTNPDAPVTTPDIVNRYDPQTGMFDVSYAAAWQLGQLLALQNKAFSTALYNWKKGVTRTEIIAAEQQIIENKYGSLTAFSAVMNTRARAITESSATPVPDNIVAWLGQLALLIGVPFNYLVPDNRMLPPETMRFFYMNNNWIDYLLAGAFSIGTVTTAESTRDVAYRQRVMPNAKRRSKTFRPRKTQLASYENISEKITGFLIRSAAVSGWPGLEINGYSDPDGLQELPKLRMEALSDDTLICIFDGAVQMVSIHEPPEALHEGLVPHGDALAITLRTLTGADPGSQIPDAYVDVSLRDDGQTLMVKKTADAIAATLNSPPYDENVDFTSAEYAVELIKGVVKVNFFNQ